MGASRGTRRAAGEPWPKGTYRDNFPGVVAVPRVGKLTGPEKRFPDDATPKQVRAYLEDGRSVLRKRIESGETKKPEGFVADVTAYLKARKGSKGYEGVAYLMGFWTEAFAAEKNSDKITHLQVGQVCSGWLTDETAPAALNTVHNRKSALSTFYNIKNGKRGYNPCVDVVLDARPDNEDYSLTDGVFEALLDSMPDRGQGIKGQERSKVNKTKIRLRLMRETGFPHKIMKQLFRDGFNREARTVRTAKRRKGKGVESREILLTPRGFAAMVAFDEADCYGSFSNSSMWKQFQRAATRIGLSEHVWPYRARHTFAAETYAASGDEKATGHLLLHSGKDGHQQVTGRYTIGGVDERARKAVEAVGARLRLVPKAS